PVFALSRRWKRSYQSRAFHGRRGLAVRRRGLVRERDRRWSRWCTTYMVRPVSRDHALLKLSGYRVMKAHLFGLLGYLGPAAELSKSPRQSPLSVQVRWCIVGFRHLLRGSGITGLQLRLRLLAIWKPNRIRRQKLAHSLQLDPKILLELPKPFFKRVKLFADDLSAQRGGISISWRQAIGIRGLRGFTFLQELSEFSHPSVGPLADDRYTNR